MQLYGGLSILWDLSFFRIAMKTDLFQSCGHGWVFQIFWHIEWSTLTASSFRTWNSLAGIPSPPLALFIVMLPKAHISLHSRMSSSRWVMMLSWLSGSWSSFLYSSSVYSCHLFLIPSAFFRSILLCPFIVPIFAWNVPLVSLIFKLIGKTLWCTRFERTSVSWMNPTLFVNHRFKEVQAFLDEGLKQTASLQQMEPLCGAQSEMRKRKKRSTE